MNKTFTWLLSNWIWMVLAALVILVFCALSGCSTEKSDRLEHKAQQSSAQKTTTEVVSSAQAKPSPISVEVTTGKDSVVHVAASQPSPALEFTKAQTKADEIGTIVESIDHSTKEGMNLGMILFLAGMGLVLLVGGIVYAHRYFQTTALGRLSSVVVDKITMNIRNLKNQAATENDPLIRADLMARANEFEALRSDVNAAAPAKK